MSKLKDSKIAIKADVENEVRISLKPTLTGAEEGKYATIGTTEKMKLPVDSVKFDSSHVKNHNSTPNFMVAQLPLLMQEEFRNMIESKFPYYKGDKSGITVFKGIMKADNVFFDRLKTIKSVYNLPDILITSDVNCLYKRSDIVNERNFEILPYMAHTVFTGTGLTKSLKAMRHLAADAMVMIADKRFYQNQSTPREWYELLHPALQDSVVFCNDTESFGQTVKAHFIRDFGTGVLKQLAKNTQETMHPFSMVNELKAGNKLMAKVYVMPYSYARTIENTTDLELIWPADGAILLPIQMLVKYGCYERYKELIQFICSHEMAKVFAANGFIPVNKKTDFECPDVKLKWLGWDYINETKLSILKY